MRVKIKYLTLTAKEPKYTTAGAAGFDISADQPALILPGKHAIIPTGLSMEIPDGFELQIRPRSGLAAKYGITVLNSPGTIDSDYRGEIKIILINLGDYDFEVKQGDRIAQGVICELPPQAIFLEEDELSDTDRGSNGFGSTGI